MSHKALEEAIASLIEKSLSDKHFKDEICFALPQKTIDKAWKNHFIDLRDFTCKIHSDEIRHICKEHGDDVHHVCKMHHYLETFVTIEKSFSAERQTGKKLPCLVFIKKSADKKIQFVKVHESRKKILSLKTLFEVV